MKRRLMRMAAMALAALFCLVATGARADASGENVKVVELDAPASWKDKADTDYVVPSDLPGFKRTTFDVAKTLPVPFDGNGMLIYGFAENSGDCPRIG